MSEVTRVNDPTKAPPDGVELHAKCVVTKFITNGKKKGEGILAKSGCDGEVARAIDPDRRVSIKISLLQNSATNAWLQAMHNKDVKTGEGTFPVLIKDLRGGLILSADTAWVLKAPSRTFGKDTNNREWTIETGPSETTE